MNKVKGIILTSLAVLLTACKAATPVGRFYDDKASIVELEGVEDLKAAFDEALMNCDFFNSEIKDSYVVIWSESGDIYAAYNVLTEEEDVWHFKVEKCCVDLYRRYVSQEYIPDFPGVFTFSEFSMKDKTGVLTPVGSF